MDPSRRQCIDMYGKLLSNTSVLSAAETELVVIGALWPINVPAQLKGNVRSALNVGATQAQVNAALRLAKMICR